MDQNKNSTGKPPSTFPNNPPTSLTQDQLKFIETKRNNAIRLRQQKLIKESVNVASTVNAASSVNKTNNQHSIEKKRIVATSSVGNGGVVSLPSSSASSTSSAPTFIPFTHPTTIKSATAKGSDNLTTSKTTTSSNQTRTFMNNASAAVTSSPTTSGSGFHEHCPTEKTRPNDVAKNQKHNATVAQPFPIFSIAQPPLQSNKGPFSIDIDNCINNPQQKKKQNPSSSFAPSLSKPMWVSVKGFGKKKSSNNQQSPNNFSAKPSTSKSGSFPTNQPSKLLPKSNQENNMASNYIKPAVGSSSLISRDRFKVQMSYNIQAISIFRNTTESQYDAVDKSWSFPLTEHNRLMESIKTLKPWVILEGLPPYVLRGLKNYHPAMLSPEPSINMIHPVLLQALMPFQKEGVIFGIKKYGRVLIADDMGLGKTIQALGIAHYYWSEWPLLIITPSSVRYCWKQSILQWIPSVSEDSIVIINSGKDTVPRIGSVSRFKELEDVQKKDDDVAESPIKVVIISYDLLQKKRLEFQGYKVIIVDESHFLKNATSARTTACLPLLQDAARAILLSGTPALSRPIELFSQISAIKPKLFTHQQFSTRYCNSKKTNYGWDYSGASNMLELNVLLREHIMIRRLKSEVLKQLPAKTRKVVHLEPNNALQCHQNNSASRFQNVLRSEIMTENEKLCKIQQFYSESAIMKLSAVREYIKDTIKQKRKFIVFAHHKIMMDGICQEIEEAKTKYIRIDGGTTSQDREYAIHQFQTMNDIRVAVLSILTANSGITLTAADLVIFAELYWNPGIITQAEDRAHRIGQTKSVTVEYLLANDTADIILWPMIQGKLTVLNKIGLSKDNFLPESNVNTSTNPNTVPPVNESRVNKHSTPSSTATSSAVSASVDYEIPDCKQTEFDDDFNEMTPTGDAILMQIDL